MGWTTVLSIIGVVVGEIVGLIEFEGYYYFGQLSSFALLGLCGAWLIIGICVLFDHLIKKLHTKITKIIDDEKKVQGYKKRKKQIKVASKFIKRQSKDAEKAVSTLEALRKDAYAAGELQNANKLIYLLESVGSNDISNLATAIRQQTQINEKIVAIEAQILQLAENYKNVGDITSYKKYWMIAKNKHLIPAGEATLHGLAQNAENDEYERKLHKRAKGTFATLIVVIVSIFAIFMYDHYQLNLAQDAFNKGYYSDTYIRINKVIGIYPGKDALKEQSFNRLGRLYYVLDSKLYMCSEDGKYTKKLMNNVYSNGEFKGCFLYFLQDGVPYALDMRTNHIGKIPISEHIVGLFEMNGAINAAGEMRDSSWWYFNDNGELVTRRIYKLNGFTYESIIEADYSPHYRDSSSSIKLNEWVVEENSKGITFTNMYNGEDNFIEGKHIDIIGYFLP